MKFFHVTYFHFTSPVERMSHFSFHLVGGVPSFHFISLHFVREMNINEY
jgi:hypothetical protein